MSLEILKTFKIVLNKANNEMEETAGNISKHLLGNKILHLAFHIINDFETMTVKSDDQSKLEQLRKNKDEPNVIKTAEHIPTGFVMYFYYLEDIKCKNNEYFCHRRGDCLNIFAEKMKKT